MNNKNTIHIPIFTLLTLLFIILKLTGIINWGWLWVFCPLWLAFIPLMIGLTFAFIMLCIGIVFTIISEILK